MSTSDATENAIDVQGSSHCPVLTVQFELLVNVTDADESRISTSARVF